MHKFVAPTYQLVDKFGPLTLLQNALHLLDVEAQK